MMNHFKRYIPLFLWALILTACSQDGTTDQTVSTAEQVDVRITLRTASHPAKTRATDDYLDPVGNNELINTYKIILAQGTTVRQVFDSDITASPAEQAEFTIRVATGTYDIYAFANVTPAQYDLSGITAGNTLPTGFADNTAVLNTSNGETGNIPMTGVMKSVTINRGANQAFAVEVVRAMAKIQFNFTNATSQSIEVLGYEIEPLTADANGIYLFETVEDPKAPTIAISIPGTNTTTTYQKSPLSINLDAGTGSGTDYCYVNETNASINVFNNQYSVRFKIKRNGTIDEVRYGFTTQESTTTPYEGFNYIHRNDWIKIPVTFTDWQFRVEMLPYTPIAGYAAYVESADALETAFNTQGYICMHPLFRNITDVPADMWRTITDSGITLTLPHKQSDYTLTGTTKAEYIAADGTGIILTGDLNIFDSKFVQLGSTENIVANLSTEKGTVTVTLRVKLGGYLYEFSHNVTRK